MIIHAGDYDPSFLDRYPVLKKPKGNPHGRNKANYRDCVCAFDIETTTIGDYNFMYIWQFQFDEDLTVIGRTWDEFRTFMADVCLSLGEDMLVVFDHNLSYEFQYLRGVYDFRPEDVFCTESRKVAKCTMFGCIEMRCSQFLSNMSLKNFTKQMNVKHQKLSGEEFDYSIQRFPWTELTDKEMDYATYDVIGLVEAVKARMEAEGDTLYTLPLTSTGFSRRDMKRAMRHYSKRRLMNMQPDLEVYDMIMEAFRGGDTHANRYYAGKMVEGVISMDRSSSYPDVMCNCPMPMQDWRADSGDPDTLMQHIHDSHAVLTEIGLVNVRLRRSDWGCPYIPRDKSRALRGAVYDNGRVLRAEYLEITVTDIDLRIIVDEYDFDDMYIGRLFWTNYEPLPDAFRHVITTYYDIKTSLKGDSTQKVRYNLTKARINSLYGMSAQRMVHPDIKFIDGEFTEVETDREEQLKRETRRSFRNIAWGCWITAWARYRLHEGIQIAEHVPGSFVYCDTDSVKYVDNGQDWSSYNKARMNDSIISGAYAKDSRDETHYMGVYELDGKYDRFITLGSKRYAYEDPDLHITVSGVGKYKGAKELGKLENFRDGFTWYHSGKTESVYVDWPEKKYLHFPEGDVELVPYIIIRDTTYTLGLTDEYRDLLALLNL